MTNSINWFEIPVSDFARAKKFYETIMDSEMMPMEMGGMKSAFFPFDMQGGAIRLRYTQENKQWVN